MSPLHFFCSEFTAEADGFFLNELLISFQLSPGPLAKSFYRSCSAAELASRQKSNIWSLQKAKKKVERVRILPFLGITPSVILFFSVIFLLSKSIK